MPKPVHLEQVAQQVADVLGVANTGQVIFNKPGDPKQVARQVLEKHKDASFDFTRERFTFELEVTGLVAGSAAERDHAAAIETSHLGAVDATLAAIRRLRDDAAP